jgi:hypothetical protein
MIAGVLLTGTKSFVDSVFYMNKEENARCSEKHIPRLVAPAA